MRGCRSRSDSPRERASWHEITSFLKQVTLANHCRKQETAGRARGAQALGELRVSIEVIRSYLLVAWQLKLLSHGGLHELTGVL